MMQFPQVPELEFVAVYDSGIPDDERMLLKVRETANLAQYAVILAWRSENGIVTPLGDFFWLGDRIVEPPTYIYIYTGKGTPQFGQLKDGAPYMTLHIGRETTLFNRPELVPVLFKIDAITIGRHFDSKLKKFHDYGDSTRKLLS